MSADVKVAEEGMMRTILLVVFLLLSWSVRAADSTVATFVCDGVSDANEQAQCVDRAAAMLRTGTDKVSDGFPWLSVIWPVGWWVLYYAFGLLIGSYIHRDAKNREWIFLGIRPTWWAVLTIFDPAMGMLIYWALHYSKFAQSYDEATASPSNATPQS